MNPETPKKVFRKKDENVKARKPRSFLEYVTDLSSSLTEIFHHPRQATSRLKTYLRFPRRKDWQNHCHHTLQTSAPFILGWTVFNTFVSLAVRKLEPQRLLLTFWTWISPLHVSASRMKGQNECQTRRTRRNKAKLFEIQALRKTLEQRDRYR